VQSATDGTRRATKPKNGGRETAGDGQRSEHPVRTTPTQLIAGELNGSGAARAGQGTAENAASPSCITVAAAKMTQTEHDRKRPVQTDTLNSP
jgi:hypothetical protein